MSLIQASYQHVSNAGQPAILKRLPASQMKQGFHLPGLLILCRDILQNPGPSCNYPCGVCQKAVRNNQRGIQCDYCDIWFHVQCMHMNTRIYEALANSSCIWECADCGLPNFSSSLFESLDAIQVTNPFWPLNSSELNSDAVNVNAGVSTPRASDLPSVVGSPQHTSSPNIGSIRLGSRKETLSVLNVNCQSLPAKRESFLQLINDIKPDIIIGTESWLTCNYNTNECFPTEIYQVERKDRPNDPHGGVFIAAKLDLALVRETNLETDCELLWCKFEVQGCKTLHIGSYYRPHVSDEKSLFELENL